MADFSGAISGIESGGNYSLLGPTTKGGDRAYGKYQVMGSNVGPWTKEVLGIGMTPQQFVANPQAQDAVFQAKFGQYVNKYGPEGAAKAWFAGERGMNNPNARDQLGTSVADYAGRFDRAIGANAPPVSGPSQQPNIPIQTAQGAPQTPTQSMQTAPNSGVVGQTPYSNQALTGGSGMPIGGLPTQSPTSDLGSPQQVNPQQMQQPPLSGPANPQIRMQNHQQNMQNFIKLLASLRGYNFLGQS